MSVVYGRFRVKRSGSRYRGEEVGSGLIERDKCLGSFWSKARAEQLALALHLTRCHAYDEARDDFRAKFGPPAPPNCPPPPRVLRCSFCDKDQSKVFELVVAPNVGICDECVRLCVEVLEGNEQLRDIRQNGT